MDDVIMKTINLFNTTTCLCLSHTRHFWSWTNMSWSFCIGWFEVWGDWLFVMFILLELLSITG